MLESCVAAHARIQGFWTLDADPMLQEIAIGLSIRILQRLVANISNVELGYQSKADATAGTDAPIGANGGGLQDAVAAATGGYVGPIDCQTILVVADDARVQGDRTGSR